MSQVAILRWNWQPAGSLVSGYSQNLAQAAGEIRRGQRSVINLKARDATGELVPSFLASSVKGVFRTAAAWLVERVAREQSAVRYVTCDYGLATPKDRRSELVIHKRDTLCPVCRVFGGAGCLGESDVAPATRRQGRVAFSFGQADDAWHTKSNVGFSTLFTWETVSLNDVPYLSRLGAILEKLIEMTKDTDNPVIDSQVLFAKADRHQVYERLRYRAVSEQISSLRDWVRVLVDDFPYPEIVQLADTLEEIYGSPDSLEDQHTLSLDALRKAGNDITDWLAKLRDRPPKRLVVEQLQVRPDVTLTARIEPADDFALALLLLAGDLASSGFFRFGRFTTRGYGVVRLRPSAYFLGGLAALLAGEEPSLTSVEAGQNGRGLAQALLKRDPLALVAGELEAWLQKG